MRHNPYPHHQLLYQRQPPVSQISCNMMVLAAHMKPMSIYGISR